jgi:hypothetical protein
MGSLPVSSLTFSNHWTKNGSTSPWTGSYNEILLPHFHKIWNTRKKGTHRFPNKNSVVQTMKVLTTYHSYVRMSRCRSQWSRGLTHELSSLVRTLGSWVRISVEACVSMCIYSVCVVLATGWSLVQEVLPTLYRINKLEKRSGSNKGLYNECDL